MPRKRLPCVDCGRLSEGKRCRPCYIEWMNTPERVALMSELSAMAQGGLDGGKEEK